MAAHKKYFERYDTAVSLEKKEYDLTRTLGITLSDAIRLGIYVMIQTMISQQDQKINSDVLEQFLEIQKRDMDDLKSYIRMQDAAQTTLQNLKNSVEKQEELIEVWDRGEEAHIRIKRSQFDPEWHTLRSPV